MQAMQIILNKNILGACLHTTRYSFIQMAAGLCEWIKSKQLLWGDMWIWMLQLVHSIESQADYES